MGHKISREQIDPRVKDEIMSLVGDISDLETEVNSDIISAVNSLIVDRVDTIENMGKIANVVGTPLSSGDSVNGAVNKLNELLSTFKTNMMNQGVTIDSGDKFKQLIDKIATLSDEDAIKKTRVIHGTTIGKQVKLDNGYTRIIVEVHGIPFEPICGYIKHSGLDDGYFISYEGLKICSTDSSNNITIYEDGFRMPTNTTESGRTYTYWVIGIGEGEDTTLRDSLANILGDKGVEVSPEDDMATLIGKVDGMSISSLDIISATSLPNTGKENQICVITDNPVDKFLITTISEEKSSDGITLYLNNTSSNDILTGTTLPITIGNLTTNYHFSKVYHYNDTRLSSYYYSGSQWNELTKAFIPILEKGVQKATSIVGSLNLGNSSSWYYSSTYNAICCPGSSSNNIVTSFTKKINFGDYSKIEVHAFEDGAVYPTLGIYSYTTAYNSTYLNTLYYDNISTNEIKAPFLNPAIYTFDISSWTGEYYLCIASLTSSSSIYIQDILLY